MKEMWNTSQLWLNVYTAVQYSTVQYSRVQYSTVEYSTVQYSTEDAESYACVLCCVYCNGGRMHITMDMMLARLR